MLYFFVSWAQLFYVLTLPSLNWWMIFPDGNEIEFRCPEFIDVYSILYPTASLCKPPLLVLNNETLGTSSTSIDKFSKTWVIFELLAHCPDWPTVMEEKYDGLKRSGGVYNSLKWSKIYIWLNKCMNFPFCVSTNC